MVTIKVVVESSGKPAKGHEVSLGLDGVFTGGSTGRQRTDERGESHFEIESRNGVVYVDGKTKYKGRLAGRIVIYI